MDDPLLEPVSQCSGQLLSGNVTVEDLRSPSAIQELLASEPYISELRVAGISQTRFLGCLHAGFRAKVFSAQAGLSCRLPRLAILY